MQMDKKHLNKRNMEWFSKKNIYIYCCIIAVLSLTSYLAAFSIEISWILEARGNLPTPSYLLCAGFFVLFIASTILIHGLATNLPWGLLSWSTIIAVISIPELYLVIYMITQHWGLQSIHGLTELVSYLLRLIINCIALLCVIPTALNWRTEKRVKSQLESLANRLQLTTPLPDAQISAPIPSNIAMSGSIRSTSSRRSRRSLNMNGFNNLAFEPQGETLPCHEQDTTINSSSENEFNASIFGLNPSMYIGPPQNQVPVTKKTQSLLDLRFLFTPKSLTKQTKEDDFSKMNNFNNNNNTNEQAMSPNSTINRSKLEKKSRLTNLINSQSDQQQEPLYHTIESCSKDLRKDLGRNCVSLENLNNTKINTFYRNDHKLYGINLLQNYAIQQWPPPPNYGQYGIYPPVQPLFYYYPMNQYLNQYPGCQGYFNSYISANSRQSVGTNSTDDFRKYRDVAL
uniref:CSON009065 protein n=1 Tax=Culicoides sonorensis TaxID=179676 RepID=A0A336N263_CULSO